MSEVICVFAAILFFMFGTGAWINTYNESSLLSIAIARYIAIAILFTCSVFLLKGNLF